MRCYCWCSGLVLSASATGISSSAFGMYLVVHMFRDIKVRTTNSQMYAGAEVDHPDGFRPAASLTK